MLQNLYVTKYQKKMGFSLGDLGIGIPDIVRFREISWRSMFSVVAVTKTIREYGDPLE